MSAEDAIGTFVENLRVRLAEGSAKYGNRSAARPVRDIVGEIDEELIDVPGWLYIMWVQAMRKAAAGDPLPEDHLRQVYVENLRQRLIRGDRDPGRRALSGLQHLAIDIECLAVDAFAAGEAIKRRLLPIAREIEAAIPTDHRRRGKRGSYTDPRSD